MTVLVTGAAGFIGSNVAKALLAEFPEADVVGIDCLDDYYNPELKMERLRELLVNPRFRFHR